MNSRVKSLQVLTKEYSVSGELKKESIQLIQNFDTNGDIIWEKEFYADSTPAWEVSYEYNDDHQTKRTVWTWLDEKDQDLTEYQYDLNNKLIKSLDYYKSSTATEFVLEEVREYHYKKNRIVKVTNLENEVQSYYKKKGKMIFGYSKDDKLKYKYLNGEFVYQNLDSIIFLYERNNIGQILKTTKTDNHGTVIWNSIYEYENGLLTKVMTQNESGILIKIEEYHYGFY